jgi:hypothetical protein
MSVAKSRGQHHSILHLLLFPELASLKKTFFRKLHLAALGCSVCLVKKFAA